MGDAERWLTDAARARQTRLLERDLLDSNSSSAGRGESRLTSALAGRALISGRFEVTWLRVTRLLRCVLCCVPCVVGGCKTWHEADSAMSAWTREHFGDSEQQGSSPQPTKQRGKRQEKDAEESKKPTTKTNEGAPDDKARANQGQPAASAAPSTTAGTGANVAAAEALFESGHEAMAAGDHDAACARFAESNRLDPAVGSLLNLAICEEKRGRLATAWQLYKRVMSDLQAGDDRYPIAQRRASALRPRVPRLTLRLEPGAPTRTKVRYADVVLEQASFEVPLPFDPGAHKLYVEAPKRERRIYDITLHEGESIELTVAPGDPE